MIPIDAIAVVTPHGRYERIMRSPKETSHCGHRTATNEIAWRRDTKKRADFEIPHLVCNACMINWMAAFVAGKQKEATA